MKELTKSKITCKELNTAYNKVQELAKKGALTDIPCFIWVGDTQLEFRFDENVGSKGAWLLASDVMVLDTDDEYIEEEL